MTDIGKNPPNTAITDNTAQPRIEVLDNGELIDYATATGENTWQYIFRNLTEGSHVMTTKSGDIISEARHITVLSTSGSEEWESFAVGQHLEPSLPYFSKSGLIIYTINTSPAFPVKPYFKNSSKGLSLVLEGGSLCELGIIFPVAATHFSFTIPDDLYNPPNYSKTRFITENGNIHEEDNILPRGDKIYTFDSPMRAVVFLRTSGGESSPAISISKITWDSPS